MTMAFPDRMLAILLFGAMLAARGLTAQQPDTVVVAGSVPAPTEEGVELPDVSRPTTPGGAFLRALILPGWGHASIGSYTRGGFYFVTESTTAFMLARTVHRIGIARDARELKEDRVRESLLAADTDPDSVSIFLGRDTEVAHARRLVATRRQQLEDWMAVGVFLLFLGGADAFVSAHLRDFPAPVAAQAALLPGGVTQIGLSVAVGGRPRPR